MSSKFQFVETLESRRLLAAGAYDTTLAGVGYLTHSINNTNDAIDVIQQADGKIVSVGDTAITSKRGLISRYSSTGALDTAFGANGTVDWSMGSGDTIVTGVAQQSDGKLVVCGFVGAGTNFDMFVCRFTTSGAFDTGFSGDGQLIIGFTGNTDFATGIAVDPASQKIYVCGSTAGFATYGAAICRINTDGALDSSYAGGGKNIYLSGTIDLQSGALATYITGRMTLDSSNRPVVATSLVNVEFVGSQFNWSFTLSSSRMGVTRVATGGAIDSTFAAFSSIPGFSNVKFNRTIELATSVAIDSRTGKIVLAGTTANGTAAFGTPLPDNVSPIKAATKANFAAARFTVSGAADKTFSGDGKVQIDFGDTRLDGATDVMVDPNGFVILGGGSQIRKQASKMAATRLSPGGAVDSTFATSGLFLQDVGGSEGFFGSWLQSDGKYLFGGHHKVNGTRGKLLIVRLLNV